MFPELQKKLTALYTVTTALILTFILCVTFLFDLSSRESRQKSLFQDQLFLLSSRLQTASILTDTELAQIELKSGLLIHIEENRIPFFFSGSYPSRTEREVLFSQAEDAAKEEGIYPNSHPISSNLLQTEVFRLTGEHWDTYLGTVLVLQTASGYKKLILLQDITKNRMEQIQAVFFYLFIDLLGIALLFLTGKWFVRRSLKPLEETYQKQQDFVAAVSHELRSPLTVIQSAVGAFQDAPDRQAHFLSMIKKECRRGSTLIKNLLLLSSADQKNWELKLVDFEMDELLLQLFEMYEPLCQAKGGTLQLQLPEYPLPLAHADPELCKQIFTILLDNAIAYGIGAEKDEDCMSGEDGMIEEDGIEGDDMTCIEEKVEKTSWPAKIILRAEVSSLSANASGSRKRINGSIKSSKISSPCITVSVVDHGPGIPDEEKDLIFDRFYRSDRSRSQKEHFGLGLSIAASLCGLQKIPIRVEDTPGGGSTFSVKI